MNEDITLKDIFSVIGMMALAFLLYEVYKKNQVADNGAISSGGAVQATDNNGKVAIVANGRPDGTYMQLFNTSQQNTIGAKSIDVVIPQGQAN